MLKTIDKIHMAGELLVGAAAAYREGRANSSDAAFARCIVLAGAAQGIVMPLLDEAGIQTSEKRIATTLAHVRGLDVPNLTPEDWKGLHRVTMGLSRLVYNNLKHTGDPNWKEKKKTPPVLPSQDRFFDANLEDEADIVITFAMDDMRALQLPLHEILSDDALDLLESAWLGGA